MLSSYIKATLRNFKKEKLNYLTAVLGLTIALTASLLILAYCLYFYDYDKQLDDYKHWYRLRVTVKNEIREYKNSLFYNSFMPKIQKEIPELEDYIEIVDYTNLIVQFNHNNQIFEMNNPLFISEGFPKHAKMQFIYGSDDLAYKDGNKIIISESLAKRYFGKKNPVGEKIFIRTFPRFTISGVFRDLPTNMSYRSDAYQLKNQSDEEQPFSSFFHVRVKIKNPNKIKLIEKNIASFLMNNRDQSTLKNHYTVSLDPIHNMHYIRGLKGETETENILNIHIALCAACLLLISAMFNFVNLHQLIWKKRNDEFIFRKTLGAETKDIIRQLFTEYSISLLISFVFAIFLYYFTFNSFSRLIDLDLNHYQLQHSRLSMTGFTLALLLGLIIAVIPILNLVRKINISEEERFKQKEKANNLFLLIQLTLSFIFISLSFVFAFQFNLLFKQNLGFDTKNLIEYAFLCTQNLDGSYGNITQISNDLKNVKGLSSFGRSSFSIVNKIHDSNDHFMDLPLYLIQQNQKVKINIRQLECSRSFLDNLSIKLISGRFPNKNSNNELVVNKTFTEYYFKGINPLGQKIYTEIKDEFGKPVFFIITGIVADADFYSLHEKRPPISFYMQEDFSNYFQIYYKLDKNKHVLEDIENVFKKHTKNTLLTYRKKDVSFAIKSYYHSDRINKNIMIFIALICSLISFIGTYSVTQTHIRKYLKEISLHKIHGAELFDVIKIYSKSYLWMFVISAFCGLFIAYYFSRLFLNMFALQINNLSLIFVISTVICGILVFVPLIFNIISAYHSQSGKYLTKE